MSNYDFVGDKLTGKLNYLYSVLRNSVVTVSTDRVFSELGRSLKSHELKLIDSKLFNVSGDEIEIKDLEQESKYLKLLQLKISSIDLVTIEKELNLSLVLKERFKAKEQLVKNIFNNYCVKYIKIL